MARAALDAGADVVNVVTGLGASDELLSTIAAARAAVILNHCRGTPQTTFEESSFQNVTLEVAQDLETARARAISSGISGQKILLDPGFGFGKTPEQNFALLGALDRLAPPGVPLVVGASRKAFLGTIAGRPANDRLPESLAAVAVAAAAAAARPVLVRVHDVAETVRFLAVLARASGDASRRSRNIAVSCALSSARTASAARRGRRPSTTKPCPGSAPRSSPCWWTPKWGRPSRSRSAATRGRRRRRSCGPSRAGSRPRAAGRASRASSPRPPWPTSWRSRTRTRASSSRRRTIRGATTASRSSRARAASCPTRWRSTSNAASRRRPPRAPAEVHRDLLLGADYVAHLVGSLPHRLDGLKVVIDAAHGAAFEVAPTAFGAAGAEVFARNVAPDGRNINEGCGALHPEGMARAVVETGASLGIALDGDADRIIVADGTGTLLDGDDVLYLWTLELEREGRKPAAVVGTVMSNWGLERALRDMGVLLIRAAVGDRYVVEEMEKSGALLGGEPSGHLIRADLTTTGDGTLTGLHIAALVAASGRPLSAQPRFVHTPQVLKNVRVREKMPFEAIPGFAARRRVAEQRLAGNGRLLLRYSGTEALARVMVEGADAALVDAVARDLADALRESLGA